jgi:hypothetical protein
MNQEEMEPEKMGRRLTIRRPATRVTAGLPPSCLTYPADPFCSITVRPVDSAVTNPADDLPGMLMFMSVCAVLLLAGVTDHGQIRDRQMTALGGVFIHAVLFHLRLRVFLHPVRFGI